jgi:hypothetical protein
VLPARLQKAPGGLVGTAQEGLPALSVCVGLGVLHELMDEELDAGGSALSTPDNLPISGVGSVPARA